MQIFLVFLSLTCICLCGYGIYGFIYSIIDKSTDFVPLIVAVVSSLVLVLIYWREIKGKDKRQEKKRKKNQKPPMTGESFRKRFLKKILFGNVLFGLIFASIIVMTFSIAMVGLGGDAFLTIWAETFIPSMCVFLIGSMIIYFRGYMSRKKCVKILQRKGLTMEACLAEMQSGVVAPISRIVLTSRALFFEKEAFVLPYSAIVWMYQTTEHVNGILVESYWNIYTDDGSRFMVKMEKQDVLFILGYYHEKLYEFPILGFTNEQKKAYRQQVKENKTKEMDQIGREAQRAERKKICMLFIALVPMMALSVYVASLLTRTVAFSQDVRLGSKCYFDVVEVEPLVWADDDIYCRCELASGETVWMKIDEYEYQEFFDSQASIYETPGEVRGVKYKEAVRLMGMAEELDPRLASVSQDARMIEFYATSALQIPSSDDAEYKHVGVAYSDSVKENWLVYADIVRIEVESFSSAYDGDLSGTATCSCTLVSGEEVTILIDIKDYKSYIDASAVFKGNLLNAVVPDPMTFITPVRIFGLMQYKKICFVYVDKEQIEEAKIENQSPVEFSDSVLERQKVYVTLLSIEPLYEVQDGQIVGVVHYICRGVCSDGKTAWIYISPSDYREYFSIDEEAIVLDHVVLYGTVVSTSHIIGAEEELNSKWLIEFDRIEANLL